MGEQAPTANPGQQPVAALRGVGPSLAASLARLGIHRVMDLLLHLPFRYQDRTNAIPLGSLRPAGNAWCRAECWTAHPPTAAAAAG